MTTLEEFSSSYYIAEMSVQPLDRGPTIERGLYDLINREIYTQTDAPVTMRIGLDAGPTFQPEAENAVPTDVLAAPAELLDQAGIHPSAQSVSVFIYKPEAAYLFAEKMSFDQDVDPEEELSDEDRNFFNLRGDDRNA